MTVWKTKTQAQRICCAVRVRLGTKQGNTKCDAKQHAAKDTSGYISEWCCGMGHVMDAADRSASETRTAFAVGRLDGSTARQLTRMAASGAGTSSATVVS